MVRTKPPGGRLTAEQFLAHLDLADRYGEGTLRLTARQGLQLHGVGKAHLSAVVQGIQASLLTTLGACGDVSRNVMCCPAPLRGDRIRTRLQAIAAEIARHFTPRSPSYYEIWLDEVPLHDAGADEEPVYGPTYLPRKFKVGLALPEDNCIEVFSQDVGLLAIVEYERLVGFNVLVGGGLGVTPKRDDTFARLAEPMAFVPAGEELRVLDAIVQVHRVHSARNDRRRARLKYLIADWGVAKFRAVVEEILERPLAPPCEVTVTGCDDHLGWREQGDGRCFLGVPLLSGRIGDSPAAQTRTALRQVLQQVRCPVRLTPQQNLLLCDLAASDRERLEGAFRGAGVPLAEDLPLLHRHALACPALPTCGLAVAEAERLLPHLLEQLQPVLERLGLADEAITLRIAGCPNACSRTATAELALVGRSPGQYAIYVGGGKHGQRLNVLYRDHVPQGELVPRLVDFLSFYKTHKQEKEGLGDCFERLKHSGQLPSPC
jgi:sulfite reductase (ferredoxin)